ncbi:MAG: cob(I)yrinic acid a,c-diamide adenosyltransferase [Planctomycetaceae bacterium]|nr:cob(I)yrinic acid a,c-diamide adenosyltransferase [Planctomycetaceae bacterium]MDG1806622.1 cob(I)yrinic acid a,c-diamide adenosyltransferase [Pirellulaceae bacterium]MDG2103661.1 cob(I)yrinic acid a,c-diamide adenosyltransferase [Pirellulaceae bacterium]
MKIYTGYGDEGFTQLLGGQRVRKNDMRVAMCGTLDELNAVMGAVASRQAATCLVVKINQVQSDLFKFGCGVAALGADTKMDLPAIGAQDSLRLEAEIDEMESCLEPLTNFLLPGGCEAAATMHQARAICRRCERLFTEVTDLYPDLDPAACLKYLNRLGDWCFVAARFINREMGVSEPIWSGQTNA